MSCGRRGSTFTLPNHAGFSARSPGTLCPERLGARSPSHCENRTSVTERTVRHSRAERTLMRRYMASGISSVVFMAHSIHFLLPPCNMGLWFYCLWRQDKVNETGCCRYRCIHFAYRESLIKPALSDDSRIQSAMGGWTKKKVLERGRQHHTPPWGRPVAFKPPRTFHKPFGVSCEPSA